MQEMIKRLVLSLLKKSSLQECTTDELKNLAEQYPWFSTAQFLYACKLKTESNYLFQEQVQRTSLYFNNSLWLDFAIRNMDKEITDTVKTLTASIPYEDSHNDELVIENSRYGVTQQEQTAESFPNAAVAIKPVETKKETLDRGLTFEPYHTVDYFASQGIKQAAEDKPQDRFSRQLKSFTEWLKAIRQMQPHEIAALSDNRSEEKVIQLADHSLEDRNVVTEAMADVWIKQGHPEKAAEIYHKLSLLNPSKSGYFAGLIENLKQS